MLYDKDIREPLFDFLEVTYGKTRILEEKTMGQSRADIVMVTPEALYGIEIKSDADTYARLARQIEDYDQYYDYNMIVAGTSHAANVSRHVPVYWGIITAEIADGTVDFYMLRSPLPNPRMDWKKKLQILWKPELASLQEWNGMPKYKDKSKMFVAGKIAERIPGKIPEEKLKKEVSDILFDRDYNTAAEVVAEYRKGEIQKLLEKTDDLQERLELMTEQAARGHTFSGGGVRKSGRRRKQKW